MRDIPVKVGLKTVITFNWPTVATFNAASPSAKAVLMPLLSASKPPPARMVPTPLSTMYKPPEISPPALTVRSPPPFCTNLPSTEPVPNTRPLVAITAERSLIAPTALMLTSPPPKAPMFSLKLLKYTHQLVFLVYRPVVASTRP